MSKEENKIIIKKIHETFDFENISYIQNNDFIEIKYKENVIINLNIKDVESIFEYQLGGDNDRERPLIDLMVNCFNKGFLGDFIDNNIKPFCALLSVICTGKGISKIINEREKQKRIKEANKNIYKILDRIGFEEYCNNSSKTLQSDKFVVRQVLFGIVQKFYEDIVLDWRYR